MSLLDSTIDFPELASRARQYGMPAVALTDHSNLFGTIKFVHACRNEKIKPIIGCEMVIHDEERTKRNHHLLLLCRNKEGYANLINLVSKSYLEGLREKEPTINKAMLLEHSNGLICLSGCLGSEIPQAILRRDHEGLEQALAFYKDCFGRENFFLELQGNELTEQATVNEALKTLSKEHGIGLVATNNCHYLDKEDAVAHAVLVAIALGVKGVSKEMREGLQVRSFHFAKGEEMASRFPMDAIERTLAIAERVENDIIGDKVPLHFPVFDTPDGSNPADFLRKLAYAGLKERLEKAWKRGESPDENAYQSRLETELSSIISLGFAPYYLIVWDFINYAKKEGIPVGPGRGSGAGSLVAFAIGITNIDPIKHGLLFERFLNPERVSPPDFDIDFCERRREEVIKYVREKYGHDRVSQIITFGTLKLKAAVKDVARVLGFSFQEANSITDKIPRQAESIMHALQVEPTLKDLYDKDERYKELFDIASKIEGLARQSGKHAAGVVIADKAIQEYAPLCVDEDTVLTQFEMEDLEAAGLVKFDFLGVTALTVIDDTLKLIQKVKGFDLRLEDIPFDDKKVYSEISAGHTAGVFQLEGKDITDVVVQAKPDRFDDLVALLALYRPGPLGGGMVQDFIARKHGLKPVSYPLDELKDVLSETYGVIVYQEQVMMIASKVAGFTLGQADLLRRVMGKKLVEKVERYRAPFLDGARQRGIQRSVAENLFDTMGHFAKYGFNKSHSAAYALLTYWTAYLKLHYSAEFLCASLSAERGDQEKATKFVSEAKRLQVKVLPPDLNKSEADFTVEGEKAIRFGLGAIKGIGDAVVDAIVSARGEGGFKTLFDFFARVDLRKVNKKALEALAKSGAFDCFGYSRKTVHDNLDVLTSWASRTKGGQRGGQAGLFVGDNMVGELPSIKAVGEWGDEEKLSAEKDVLGCFLSAHPLDSVQGNLEGAGLPRIQDLRGMKSGERVGTVGVVVAVQEKKTRQGSKMAFFTLEDQSGHIECIAWPKVYAQISKILSTRRPLLVRGEIKVETQEESEDVKVVVDSIDFFDRAIYALAKKVIIKIDITKATEADIVRLSELLFEHKGTTELLLELYMPDVGSMTLRPKAMFYCQPSAGLLEKVKGLFGKNSIRYL
jgi:DNA polymerase-3 subunit alpha